MSALFPFAHAWMWLGLAVSTSLASQAATSSPHNAATEVRGTYGNHGLWLSLGDAADATGAQAATQQDDLMTELRSERRVEKADYVVLDVRGSHGIPAELSRSLSVQLWGSRALPAQPVALSESALAPRRLKPGAHVFVIADDHCASTCKAAVEAWQRNGAVSLDVPQEVLTQDDVALEAWVLATAEAPRATGSVAASPAATQSARP